MNISQPYLLFLGDVTDPLSAKTRAVLLSGAQMLVWDN